MNNYYIDQLHGNFFRLSSPLIPCYFYDIECLKEIYQHVLIQKFQFLIIGHIMRRNYTHMDKYSC